MKIGVLGWDHGETDFDALCYLEYGREHGHETTLFTLEDISYAASAGGGFEVLAAGLPATDFDAVISRAKLYGEDWQDRVERLTALSNVLGTRMFDPAENWVTGYSKLLCAQRLAAAGLSVLPTRSVRSMAEITQAIEEWGEVVVKPSFEFSGKDVERICDPTTDADLASTLLDRYSTLVCVPFWPTRYGEYRLTVAGDTSCITTLKLPPLSAWRCKTLEGATFERVSEPPAELAEMGFAAARAMGLTLSGVDVLPTDDGYVILEANPVPGFLDLHGDEARLETTAAIYDWVQKRLAAL